MIVQIVIWGTGIVAERICNYPLKEGVNIEAVVDNNSDKWGEKFLNYTILAPTELQNLSYDKIVILSSKYASEIYSQLIEMGIDESKIVKSEMYVSLNVFKTELDDYFDIEKKVVPWKPGSPKEGYKVVKAETFKSKERRLREGFFEKYCQGEGLDIGWGGDLLAPNCSVWDIENGDAQYLEGIKNETFDFVYSSHCLEHVRDVRVALQNWFRVVKKGGYLIVAIPHRDLYEKKKCLPSRWNSDHKHMFLIGKSEAPDTLDIVEEIRLSLDNYDIKYVKTCDEGHTITDPLIHSDGEYQIELVIRKMKDDEID